MSASAESLPLPQRATTLDDRGKYELGDGVAARHMVLIDQIINWMLVNPGKPMTQCARAFSLTPLFVRAVTTSDAFRARYHEVRGTTLQEVGILSLKEKVAAAADLAVERLAEKIPLMESTGELVDATEMLLAQTYGKPGAGGVQPPAPQVSVTVQAAILESRDKILGVAVSQSVPAEAPPSPVLSHAEAAAPTPLSAPGEGTVPVPASPEPTT